MTEIKFLELMDAIQQTQKTADDMWRVLREVLEEQGNAQQNAHLTGLHCPACMCRNEEIVTCARCGTVKSAPQVA